MRTTDRPNDGESAVPCGHASGMGPQQAVSYAGEVTQQTLLILGASGDLTARLLLPGLGGSAGWGRGKGVSLLGSAIDDWQDEEWRRRVADSFASARASGPQVDAVAQGARLRRGAGGARAPRRHHRMGRCDRDRRARCWRSWRSPRSWASRSASHYCWPRSPAARRLRDNGLDRRAPGAAQHRSKSPWAALLAG
jgi:hypothetical protein